MVGTMGGLNPAYDFVKRSLLAGKSVVTSIKSWWRPRATSCWLSPGTGT